MNYEIEYKIFPWGIRATEFEKALKEVKKFLNKPGIKNHVLSLMNTSFGIVVWYESYSSLKINLKKP